MKYYLVKDIYRNKKFVVSAYCISVASERAVRRMMDGIKTKDLSLSFHISEITRQEYYEMEKRS